MLQYRGEIKINEIDIAEKIITNVDLLNDKAFKIALDNFDVFFNDLVQ